MTTIVKGTVLRTESELDGTYTVHLCRSEGGLRTVQMLSLNFIRALYEVMGPSQEVEFTLYA